jgi:hypothetical protein
MSVTETRYEHIAVDDQQTPIIVGTTMKVIELVLETQAYGWSAEELHFQHPYFIWISPPPPSAFDESGGCK